MTLAQLRAAVPAQVGAALVTVLGDSPDPDSALHIFERLCGNAESVRGFERNLALVDYAVTLAGHSPYLGEVLVQHPDVLLALSRDKNLERGHSLEEFREHFARFRSRSFEREAATLLGRFKKRELVRIGLRDVLGIAQLAETTAELSALDDVLLEQALFEADHALRQRYGAPQTIAGEGRMGEVPVTILSLGKLGGNEVNYSSDVDLLFLYGDGEAPEGARISLREYFIRLAQNVTEVLSKVTTEGAVFRIDLRLRPQGSEGELAVALHAALRYYSGSAQDWELQALIKARHSAGDLDLARRFLRGVQPRVYTASLNFAAIETAMKSLKKISSRRRLQAAEHRHEAAINVKVDRGGIRDIEFLVQCLQRVYGGSDAWLRSGGTLFSLLKLHDKGHISGHDYHQLTHAYTELRRVEHRLQLRHGQQLHRLPASREEIEILSRSLAVRGVAASEADEFVASLALTMEQVAGIYDRLIHSEQQHQGVASPYTLSPTPGLAQESFAKVLDRIALDSPELHAAISRQGLSAFARRNLHRFLSSALTTPERYQTVLQHPEAIERALEIFHASGHLSDVLARHPEVIEAFASRVVVGEHASLFAAALQAEPLPKADHSGDSSANSAFSAIAASGLSYREKLDLLRQRFRLMMFESAAHDVMHPGPVFASLLKMSSLANGAIAAAWEIAGGGGDAAILAVGRLGTSDFDWDSDADLLFIRAEDSSAEDVAGRVGRLLEAVSAYTRYGNLFAVDARLRPRGREGELVNTPSMLQEYFAVEAQSWEALTYTKLRYVAGSKPVADRAIRAVVDSLPRFASEPGFTAQVRDMRARVEKTDPGKRNLKVSPGAFYDIDFLLSWLEVRSQRFAAAATGTPARIARIARIEGLAASGGLNASDAAALQSAAELYRTVDHAIRLVTGRSRAWLPNNEAARKAITELCEKMLRQDLPAGLEAELHERFRQVRELFDRHLQ